MQNFDIVGIRSLAPVDVMFFPFSYNIQFGINRVMNPDTEEEGYSADLVVGGGVTYAVSDNIKVFGFMNNHVSYGGFLPHNQWSGIGANGGIYADFGDWRILADAEKIWATSQFGDKIKYKAEIAYSLSVNSSVALNYMFEDNHGHDVDESMLSWRWHF